MPATKPMLLYSVQSDAWETIVQKLDCRSLAALLRCAKQLALLLVEMVQPILKEEHKRREKARKKRELREWLISEVGIAERFVDGEHMPLYEAIGVHCKDELARLAKSPRFDELTGIAEFSKRRILRAFKRESMDALSLSPSVDGTAASSSAPSTLVVAAPPSVPMAPIDAAARAVANSSQTPTGDASKSTGKISSSGSIDSYCLVLTQY